MERGKVGRGNTKKNIKKPPDKRKRPRYFQAPLPDPSESSDTVDTDAADDDVPLHFGYSGKIVPHCFVHLAQQVKFGGTHQFHNTSAPESKHPSCIQLPGTRVRKYRAENVTEDSMLDYTLDLQLFDEIAVMVQHTDTPPGVNTPSQDTNSPSVVSLVHQTTARLNSWRRFP